MGAAAEGKYFEDEPRSDPENELVSGKIPSDAEQLLYSENKPP